VSIHRPTKALSNENSTTGYQTTYPRTNRQTARFCHPTNPSACQHVHRVAQKGKLSAPKPPSTLRINRRGAIFSKRNRGQATAVPRRVGWKGGEKNDLSLSGKEVGDHGLGVWEIAQVWRALPSSKERLGHGFLIGHSVDTRRTFHLGSPRSNIFRDLWPEKEKLSRAS